MENYIAGFAAVLLIITRLTVWIAKKFSKTLSPYKVFGITDIIFGIVILIIAIIDNVTPGGDLNGLFGQALLIIFEPAVILFLIIDIFLYKKAGKKN